MAAYDVGPLYAKVHYNVGSHSHVMTVPLWCGSGFTTPPEVGSDPMILSNDSGETTSQAVLNALVQALKHLLYSDSGFTTYDLFYKASIHTAPIWLFSGDFASAVGVATGTPKIASQLTITFRTSAGHHYRLQIMESEVGVDSVVGASDLIATSPWAAITTAVCGDASAIVGRDGSRVVAPLRLVTKTNDRLRRRFLIS